MNKRLSKLRQKMDLLESDIRNLKYRTIRTVLKVYRRNDNNHILWDSRATTPLDLFQKIVDGVYIDP